MTVLTKTPITFAEVSRRVPSVKRPGNHISAMTPKRWARTGVRVNGQRIILGSGYHGAVWCTTVEELAIFFERIEAASRGETIPSNELTQVSKDRRVKAASKVLDDAGL